MPDETVVEARARGDGAVHVGALSFLIDGGALRAVAFDGVEAVRGVDCPIRDADWRTHPVVEIKARLEAGPDAARYLRRFRTEDGAFEGRLEVEAEGGRDAASLSVRLTLEPRAAAVVNRAGFVLLHPIAGVAGVEVEVLRPSGLRETARFPALISPGQPVFDIAGLSHRVGPVAVEIRMEGEVFEMEDQRNWTDASYKTYCRPLGWPRPYTLAAGETVRQAIHLRLSRAAGAAAPAAAAPEAEVRAPDIHLAHEAALCAAPPAALADLGVAGLLVRIDARAPDLALPSVGGDVTLEIVVGPDAAGDLARVAAACAAAGLAPARVVALPAAYLQSHQPEGPWPDGPDPNAMPALVRAAFPGVAVGGGMLTNFTEFNRRRPDPAGLDFATFGTTAIVHAADDRSVLETLEALGDVFASARAIVGAAPIWLGLMSIGMRSNPYGAATAANPGRVRIAMALDDPRQSTEFAAAWAVAAAAAAARGGVTSFAPAMTAGPIGMGRDGALWPIFQAVAALAALGGASVRVFGGPASGLVGLLGRGRRGVRGVVANLGPDPARHAPPEGVALRLIDAAAATDPRWIDGPGRPGPATLPPFGVAVLKETSR